MKNWLALVVVLAGLGCATPRGTGGALPLPRIQALESTLGLADRYPCVQGLQPIPATVIDVGVFKNVPYQSFSNGRVEVNAYGDPADLVGLEAGTVHRDPDLQRCLINFIAAQALLASDRQEIANSPVEPRTIDLNGLTVETTPPTDADAYGSWWISLERRELISHATARPAELHEVSTPRASWSSPPLVSSPVDSSPTYAPSYSPPSYSPPSYSSYRPSSGGRVYVHGYTRKNGTYVHPHSRRR